MSFGFYYVPTLRLVSGKQVFLDLDFTLLEMNPFTLDPKGMPFPLDMRGELDDTAAFKSGKKWGDLEFPLPFGRTMTSAEEHVHDLDSNTGGSCCSLAACAHNALFANTSIDHKLHMSRLLRP